MRAEEGVGTSGVSGTVAGEGLARLDDGSLTVGFFLLRKGGLEMESSNNEEGCPKVTLTWAD
jgi:hypothetical protein